MLSPISLSGQLAVVRSPHACDKGVMVLNAIFLDGNVEVLDHLRHLRVKAYVCLLLISGCAGQFRI